MPCLNSFNVFFGLGSWCERWSTMDVLHDDTCVRAFFIQVTQVVFNFSLMTYTCLRIFLSPPWLMVLCQRWSASNSCSVLSVWWFTCVCAILNYVEAPFPTHFIDISVLGGWSALYHVGIFYIAVLFPSTHIRLTRPGCPINFTISRWCENVHRAGKQMY